MSALLLYVVPVQFKERAHAGFAITLVSALTAHLSVGDGREVWGWAAGTGLSGAYRTSSGVGGRPTQSSQARAKGLTKSNGRIVDYPASTQERTISGSL